MFGWISTDATWFIVIGPMMVLAVFAYVIRRQRQKASRRRSLRRDDGGGYVWIEIDGTPRRSDTDPRDKWDAEDGSDGDGDGGGD